LSNGQQEFAVCFSLGLHFGQHFFSVGFSLGLHFGQHFFSVGFSLGLRRLSSARYGEYTASSAIA
jgi:hypothetical protein